MSLLQELSALPDGLLKLPASELEAFLGGPTLIHLPGREDRPLFVSVLMHGNETVGWEAMRSLLQRYDVAGGDKPMPRALSLFIGNVSAAREGMRHLPGQPDYNRVWPGCPKQSQQPEPSPEQAMMHDIVECMAKRQVFASIDVHNNTGLNPHYACVNVIGDDFLHLAALFGRTVVYFTDPCQVASRAMAQLCPSVTLECGKVGQQHGVDHAIDYLDACLHLHEFPSHPVAGHDVDLFHTVATVKLSGEVSFGFDEADVELDFAADIEFMNFRELTAGTSFGRYHGDGDLPLVVTDGNGKRVDGKFFKLVDGEILLRSALMPSMLTRDKLVIRQDCLCYLMERYDLEKTR